MSEATDVDRDAVFRDFFHKLDQHSKTVDKLPQGGRLGTVGYGVLLSGTDPGGGFPTLPMPVSCYERRRHRLCSEYRRGAVLGLTAVRRIQWQGCWS